MHDYYNVNGSINTLDVAATRNMSLIVLSYHSLSICCGVQVVIWRDVVEKIDHINVLLSN